MSGGNAGRSLARAEFLAIPFSKGKNMCQRNFVELYDCLLLMNHCLLRVQDLYRIRVNNFSPYTDKRTGLSALEISLPDPKTKQLKKTYSTTERAIEYWDRIRSRSENKDSYCFFPQYARPIGNPENGRTYKVLRQCFKAALKEAGLENDSFGRPYTLTSVRHTAFMLVLERNEGRIDLQTLAQNGHTSVEMLSRTYLAHHNVKKRLPDLLHGSNFLP
jgi:integrase